MSIPHNPVLETGQVAESQLRSSPYPALHGLTCEFSEGVLTLRGRVPTYYLKQIAQAAVLQLDGVSEVVNSVDVVSSQFPRLVRSGEPEQQSMRAFCVSETSRCGTEQDDDQRF